MSHSWDLISTAAKIAGVCEWKLKTLISLAAVLQIKKIKEGCFCLKTEVIQFPTKYENISYLNLIITVFTPFSTDYSKTIIYEVVHWFFCLPLIKDWNTGFYYFIGIKEGKRYCLLVCFSLILIISFYKFCWCRCNLFIFSWDKYKPPWIPLQFCQGLQKIFQTVQGVGLYLW